MVIFRKSPSFGMKIPPWALVALLSFALLSMTAAQIDGNESCVPDSIDPSQIPETPPGSPPASPRRTRSRVAAASGGAAGPPSRGPSAELPTLRFNRNGTEQQGRARMQNTSDLEAGAPEPRSSGKEPKNETSASKPQVKHPKIYGAYGASQSQGAACGSKKKRARDDGEGCSSQSPGARGFTSSGRASRPGAQYLPSANIREGESGCSKPRCNGAAAGWSELPPPPVELVSLPDARPTRKHWNKKWIVSAVPTISRGYRVSSIALQVMSAASDRTIFSIDEYQSIDMNALKRRRDMYARALHPDRTSGLDEHVQVDANHAFVRVNDAFERLELIHHLLNGINVFEGSEPDRLMERRDRYKKLLESGEEVPDVHHAMIILMQNYGNVVGSGAFLEELLTADSGSPAASIAGESQVGEGSEFYSSDGESAAGGMLMIENGVIDLCNSTDEEVADIDAAVASKTAEEALEEAEMTGNIAQVNPEYADVAADAAAAAHEALDAAFEARQVAEERRKYNKKKQAWSSAKQRKKDLKAEKKAELEERNFLLGRDCVLMRDMWNDLTPLQQDAQDALWEKEFNDLWDDVKRLQQRLRRAKTKAERDTIKKEIQYAKRLHDEHVCRWNFARDLPLTRTHESCLRLYERLMALNNPYWNALNGDDDVNGDDDTDEAGGGAGGRGG
jgi:hypothetical protein